jgi:hypothetical protein
MKIDRGKFLFLTSALFACASKTEPVNDPGSAVTIPPQPPPPPAASPTADKNAEAPAADAGTSRDVPVAVSDDEDEEPYEPWPGTAQPPLAKTVHAQSCDVAENAKGKAVACTLKPAPGPTCESFGETRSDCPKLSRWLVPKVAEKAAACLNAKSGKKDICLFNVGPSCVIEALSSACLDPSPKVASSCERVMSRCARVERKHRHMTADACKAAMSAIVPASQTKFLSCAAESCDLVPCMYAAQR